MIIIRLGHKSLYGSSNLPGSNVGHAIRNPIWSCSEWSLPCNRLLLAARCAFTAPFHPYQSEDWRSSLCCTCRGLAPPAVNWHSALWSPDFPPPDHFRHRQRLSWLTRRGLYLRIMPSAVKIYPFSSIIVLYSAFFSYQSNRLQYRRLFSLAFRFQAALAFYVLQAVRRLLA